MSISKTTPTVLITLKAIKKLERATMKQIGSETGINEGTLKHAICWMKKQKMIHVCGFKPGVAGGSKSNIYAAGKAPDGLVINQDRDTSPVKNMAKLATIRFFKGVPIIPDDNLLSIFMKKGASNGVRK